MNEKELNYTFDSIRIVMVNTTEAGNIGAAARAMKNMALKNLYLVNPNNYPSAKATARASGADDVLANAIVCNNLNDALMGCDLIIGASARQRTIKWQQLDVKASTKLIKETVFNKQKVAVVFGRENSGLTNKELDLCQVLMTIPGNKEYFSLNVASAVQVFAYQNFITFTDNKTLVNNNKNKEIASFSDMENFYNHLEQTLININYFDDNKPKEKLMRRLRRLFHRAMIEKDEVAILRGILKRINI